MKFADLTESQKSFVESGSTNCVAFGPRQSGKSTALLHAVNNRPRNIYDATILYPSAGLADMQMDQYIGMFDTNRIDRAARIVYEDPGTIKFTTESSNQFIGSGDGIYIDDAEFVTRHAKLHEVCDYVYSVRTGIPSKDVCDTVDEIRTLPLLPNIDRNMVGEFDGSPHMLGHKIDIDDHMMSCIFCGTTYERETDSPLEELYAYGHFKNADCKIVK